MYRAEIGRVNHNATEYESFCSLMVLRKVKLKFGNFLVGTFSEVPLKAEKEMETHSRILVWRIPWTEEPGGLQSTGSKRVRHD